MDPRSSPVFDVIGRESRLYVTDIAIDWPHGERGGDAPLHLTEICLFGISGHDDGKCVSLRQSTPRRWEANGAYELARDAEGVDCILKSGDGSDFGCAYLPCTVSARRQDVATFDEEIHLTIAWEVAEIPEEHRPPTMNHRIVPAPDILYAYHPALDRQILGNATKLFSRAQSTRSVADLGEGISIIENALHVATEGHPMHPLLLSNLGVFLLKRFQWGKAPGDLDKATTALSMALKLIPHGHPNIGVLAQNLGAAFTEQYERSGDLSCVERAISAFRIAVMPDCHGMASNSISTAQIVASVTPACGEQVLGSLGALGSVLRVRFEHAGDVRDATDRVAVYRKSLVLTPPWHPSVPQIITRIGSALAHAYEHSGNPCDIDEALELHRKAVGLTLGRDPEPMGDLGKAFHIRFGRTGDLADIDEAISAHRRTVELFQAGDECLPVALSNLGASLVSRFKDVGDLRDAAEAIAVQHKAVGITPQSPRVLSFTLESLAISFLIRFAHTTEDSDVSEAISAIRRAVQLTHPPIPHRVSVLGNALSLRFSSSGDRSDIDEAISMQQTAVSLTSNTDPNLPRHLTNLGSSFIQRYKSMTEPSDIDAAISALEKAVELTPDGHADLPVRLDHLGSAHSFRLLHSVDLVGKAKAVASLGSTDDTKQFASVNDGICVFYKAIGENLQANPGTKEYSGDNDRVIEILQKAVELTPEGHAMLPSRLAHLSWGLQRRFMTSGDRPTLTKVLSVLKRAATCTPGPPHDRLTAAITWAELLALEWPSPDTIPAFGTAMDLVALVAGLERSVELRHSQLREVSDLPLRAAVAACELGRLDKAIEWLEQGRCLVWRQLTNLRTPLDALRAHDAQLAEKVMGVSKRLEDTGASRRRPDAGMTQSERISLEAEARNQLQLSRQWDDLLARVRAIPEFEDFLKPTPYSTILRDLPDSGPIVVINVHAHQCDGFALLAGLDEPLHIPLPDLSLEKVVKYQKDLGSHLGKQGLRMRSEEEGDLDQDDPNRFIVRYRRRPAGMEDVTRNALKCLWMEIVKPVLDALGFSNAKDSPQESLPRIWWCPTGPLSFLPIHAAGVYGEVNAECLLDYAVSSYTPTVTAVTERVKRDGSIDEEKCGLLLTSQPKAPGASRITGTTKEVASVHTQAATYGVRTLKLDGDELSADQCLKRMGDFSSVHLACHASQNASEPLQSRFLFHKGHLTLNSIMQKNLKHADLAFLSACQTSTGEATLAEEAVHLAAGMLAAGYRRVVATMWSINDAYAPDVANDFYEYLWKHRDEGSGTRFDGALSAHALHYAIQKLRRRLKGDPEQSLLAWVPYVHFGY